MFTIAVDEKYAGRKMSVECRGCLRKLVVKIPVPTKEDISNGTVFEGVVSRIDDVLESVSGAFVTFVDTLGNIRVADIFGGKGPSDKTLH
jgi:hypothetical protein